MTLIKTALLIPAVASGIWLAKKTPHPVAPSTEVNQNDPNLHVAAPSQKLQKLEALAGPAKKDTALTEDAIVVRRLRIERILMTLDRVAEVSLQMSPDNAASLEPVIVDLAERTLDLTSEKAVLSQATDGELTQIERTVGRLVDAVEKLVEPEMSL